jgi:uncharacterized protein involved in exopolysaccharide biosynthesis
VSIDISDEVVGPGPTPRAQGISSGSLVSLHFVKRELKRRRRLWVTVALLGFVAGLGFSILPKQYSAATTLLLKPPVGEDPAQAMTTNLSLLKTRRVAERAIARLGVHLTSDQLLAQYNGRAASNQLLRITAHGRTAAEAVRRSDAVAQGFLSFRHDELERQLQGVVKPLQDRQTQLQTQADALTAQISHISANASSDQSALSDLVAQRQAITSEQVQLQQQAQDDTSNTTAVVNSSTVLDPANLLPRSKVKTIATNAATGLLGGLALGLGWVCVTSVASESVRTRDDLMMAMGAPIGLSVGRVSVPRLARTRRFRGRVARPSPTIRLVVSYLRRQIARPVDPTPAASSNGNSPPSTGSPATIGPPSSIGPRVRIGRPSGNGLGAAPHQPQPADQGYGGFRVTGGGARRRDGGIRVTRAQETQGRWAQAHSLNPRPINRLQPQPASVNGPTLNGTLGVVAIEATEVSSLAVACLALELVREGTRVVVADLSAGAVLARLGRRGFPGAGAGGVEPGELRIAVPPRDASLHENEPWAWFNPLLGERGECRAANLRDWANVRIALATLDPAVGAGTLSYWTRTAVALVTAGRSTGVKLRASAELLRSAAITLQSTILIAADPTDESTGVVDRSATSAGRGVVPRDVPARAAEDR